MIITCPYCGPRPHSEFTYRGDATVERPSVDNTSIEDHARYVFDRKNPAGPHRELWNHTGGCRMHVVVTRDTVTHDVTSCEPIGPFADQLKKEAKA